MENLAREWSKAVERSEPATLQEWIEQIRFGQWVGPTRSQPDCTWIEFPRSAETRELFEIDLADSASPETLEALEILQEGLVGGDLATAIGDMGRLPETAPFRNEFLGDLHFLSEDFPVAAQFYRDELDLRPTDASYAARSAIASAAEAEDRALLSDLLRTPVIERWIPPGEKLRHFAEARDIPGVAVATVEFELSSLLRASTVPSLGIAAIWYLILMPFWEIHRSRILAALVAFALGIVSASLTLFFVILQERIQGFDFHPNAPPISQFLYFVTGVGLREETLKLVCFLPIAWWAVRRKSDIEGMMLAAMVGLGFAFKENVLYLDSGLSTYTGWVRFLTANVLHFSLTGIAGFYLFRMLRRRGHGWEEFLASFIAVVFAHGVYNSLLAMPSLESYAPLAPIFIAIIAYRFFDPLRGTMDSTGIGHRISPLGVFVLGSVILACLVLVFSSLAMPFRFALGAFLASVAGMIPLAFAFISRFRDL